MQPIPDRQYEYKANLPTLLLGVLLFGVAALFFSYKARSNVRGLIINGIITLSPEGATIFWWVFAGLSVAFVLAGIAGAILAMIFTQRVVLTARCLIVPKSRWSSKEVEIPYSSIIGVSDWQYRGNRCIIIRHQGGKATISSLMLTSKAGYNEIRFSLAERIEASKNESR